MRSACSWTMDHVGCTMYRWTMTHSRLTAVRPAGKSCAFVQTALRPSAVLYHVFDYVRVAHVFADRMMNVAGGFLGVRVMRSASTRSCSLISEVFFL